MELFVHCQCGNRIAVTSAHAGNRVHCHCGQDVGVPSLGELRRMAGQAAYSVDIVEKLRCLYLEGKLPLETECLGCHVATGNFLRCTIECERTFIRGPGFWQTLLTTLFTPFWIWKHLHDEYRNPEVLGNERVVRAPLRICASCADQVKNRPKEARRLLRQSSLYDELLAEYPNAQISIAAQLSSENSADTVA